MLKMLAYNRPNRKGVQYFFQLEGERSVSTMKPLFLTGVEENPQPGPYRDTIAMMKGAGLEYPQIWHLFAFLPSATEHLAKFTQEIMRGPGPLSPGMRELIAAFTSYRNDCPF
jgi:hypothetical protein